jgi:hypothetical protein
MTMSRFVFGALAAALLAAPTTAFADRSTDDLASQPAVRHRVLLVAKRLEATPLFEATLNADFRHFIGGGLKLEYHVNDMLSFGAIGVGSASIDTAKPSPSIRWGPLPPVQRVRIA